VPDDAEIAGLDPFDLLDQEAARLDHYFAQLPAAEWARPSRCAGWTIRDVLAHLTASEAYHQACLDGEVEALLGDLAAKGATDMDGANAVGVAEYAGWSPGQLLDEWRRLDGDTRRRFRDRGDGTVDTTVGDYPGPWQAFHVASELATHADDVYVPVADDERTARQAWRAQVSRFALGEAKPDLAIAAAGGHTQVSGLGVDVQLDDELLVEGVADRLGSSSGLDPDVRAVLSTFT
jgi:uncharacterized protein (TIGR03083 family)